MKFYTDWEDFKDTKLCNAWVATAIIGAGALGAGATIFASSKAKEAQTNAANTAANTALSTYGQTKATLSPFVQGGTDALAQLKANNYYTNPIVMDQATLENTPGYQFTKTQGLKAVQNAAAARGLGVSGAALKGAANFATGLADSTYKTQFDIANTNQTNAYNRLKGLVDTGGNAAAGVGNIGQTAASTASNAQIGAGNAQAAAANATGGAITGFANNVGGYAAYKGLYGGNNDFLTPSEYARGFPGGSPGSSAP